MPDTKELLKNAKSGDIRAFHILFSDFQPRLKSYLYRLAANRNDMEDWAHDVFILAYENLSSFRGESSLKTWVFTIATNHARKQLKAKKPWYMGTMERTRELAHQDKNVMYALDYAHQFSPLGSFEIREHIDYCFTCVSKMLPLEQQIALILKDIFDFKVMEISEIMNTSHGTVKHLLHNARKKMIGIFDDTCRLVSKRGVFVTVDDVEATAKLAQELGAKTVVPLTDVPEVGKFYAFQDPQGAVISVVTYVG